MDIRRKEKLGTAENVTGHSVRVKVVKNKMAPPFKEATFDIIYPNGIDKVSSLLDAAVTLGVVGKSGAWFSMGDKQLAQGRDGTKELMKTDTELRKKIYAEVRKKMDK